MDREENFWPQKQMRSVASNSSISTASTSLNGSLQELNGANEQFPHDQTVIGVLALQGAFIEHIHILERTKKVKTIQVRLPEDLKHIHGLVIPGGESTAISSLAERWGMVRQSSCHVIDLTSPCFDADEAAARMG